MTPAEMLQVLGRWRDAGWLRSLDVALARWLHETDSAAPPSLLLAAALVAQMEGRGHSGLPLTALAADPPATLDWPAEARDECARAFADWPVDQERLRAVWSAARAAGPDRAALVEFDPSNDAGASPLVVAGDLLLLRRYWRDELHVAAQVRARAATVVSASVDEPQPLSLQSPSSGSLPGRAQGASQGPSQGRSQDLSHGPSGGSSPAVDPARARHLLGLLFPPAPPGEVDWQQVACALAVRGRLTLVTGGPGTGKTYTAARMLVLLQALHAGPQPLRVALAAPTGKAAARLRQSISKAMQGLREQLGTALPLDEWASQLAPARTLHSLLGTQPGTRRFRHDAGNPLEVDVLFVDEASMVHLEMMARLLDALSPAARLVLLGDKDQLASVEAGAVMGDLCHGAGAGGAEGGYRPAAAAWIEQVTGRALPPEELGPGPALAQQTVMLRRSHRFEGPIGQLAVAVNRGDAPAALELLRTRPDGAVAFAQARDAGAVLPLAAQGRPGAPGGYRDYLAALAQRPAKAAASGASADGRFDEWVRGVLRRFDAFRVLCVVREGAWGVAGLNAAIERALAEAGALPSRRGEWYEGRPVMVTRNSPELGVFNGDVGIVLRSPVGEGALRAYFADGEALRSVSVGRLADVETAFAMTVHKSQGSEFEHVLLVLPDEDVQVLTRELLYTGITRASRALTLLCTNPARLVAAAGRLTRRVSGLRAMLA
ncbi:MAG: exodeoxyribonuclease V subunit alpha [Rubrivivax sp.]|nr:exodeoxyribonuclease V subunit alpha [Rubrivivax sp.]